MVSDSPCEKMIPIERHFYQIEIRKKKSYRLYSREYMKFVENIIDIVSNSIQQVEIFTAKTSFFSAKEPDISIRDYIYRIVDSELMSVESIIISLIYLKRLIYNTENNFFNQYTVHRIFLTSILLGSKYLDDEIYNNKEFSILGGINVPNLNSMELEFLYRLGFELYIDLKEYQYYHKVLSS